MAFETIRALARSVKLDRANADVSESKLRLELDQECSQHGAAITLAGKLHIKPQYLSDIRHGRRRVSDQVIEKLGRLK